MCLDYVVRSILFADVKYYAMLCLVVNNVGPSFFTIPATNIPKPSTRIHPTKYHVAFCEPLDFHELQKLAIALLNN